MTLRCHSMSQRLQKRGSPRHLRRDRRSSSSCMTLCSREMLDLLLKSQCLRLVVKTHQWLRCVHVCYCNTVCEIALLTIPSLTPSSPPSQVYRFYEYWINFESWRDFTGVGAEHKIDDAMSRDEKRYYAKVLHYSTCHCLSYCLCIHLCLCLYLRHCLYLCHCLCVQLYLCLSICICVLPTTSLFIRLSSCLSLFVFLYLLTPLCFCPPLLSRPPWPEHRTPMHTHAIVLEHCNTTIHHSTSHSSLIVHTMRQWYYRRTKRRRRR